MLNRTFQLLLATCLVAGNSSAADAPFVGEWKLDPSRSKLTDQMKVESLGANKYSLDFGEGRRRDDFGRWSGPPRQFRNYAVSDRRGSTGLEGCPQEEWPHARHCEVASSQDNNTLTDNFTFVPQNGAPTNVKYTYKKSGRGSGFAGTWVSTSEAMKSVFVLQIRPYEGDGLSFIYSSEERKNVKFDGKDYPNVGPIEGGPTSSIRRVHEHALEMTDKIDGKITKTEQITLSSDLKTLTIAERTASGSELTILIFERQ